MVTDEVESYMLYSDKNRSIAQCPFWAIPCSLRLYLDDAIIIEGVLHMLFPFTVPS